MGVIAEGIPRGCQGLFTPVSLGYPLSVFNINSTLKAKMASSRVFPSPTVVIANNKGATKEVGMTLTRDPADSSGLDFFTAL